MLLPDGAFCPCSWPASTVDGPDTGVALAEGEAPAVVPVGPGVAGPGAAVVAVPPFASLPPSGSPLESAIPAPIAMAATTATAPITAPLLRPLLLGSSPGCGRECSA